MVMTLFPFFVLVMFILVQHDSNSISLFPFPTAAVLARPHDLLPHHDSPALFAN